MKTFISLFLLFATCNFDVKGQTVTNKMSFGVHNSIYLQPLIDRDLNSQNYALMPVTRGSKFKPVYFKKGGVTIGIHAALDRHIYRKISIISRISIDYSEFKVQYNSLVARPMVHSNDPWIYTNVTGNNTVLKRQYALVALCLGAKFLLIDNKSSIFSLSSGLDVLTDIAPLNSMLYNPNLPDNNKASDIIIGVNTWRRKFIQIQPFVGLNWCKKTNKSIDLQLRYSQINFGTFYDSEVVYLTAHNFKSIKNIEPTFGRIEFGLNYYLNK